MELELMALTPSGRLIPVASGRNPACAVSGVPGDGDLFCEELGDRAVFCRIEGGVAHLSAARGLKKEKPAQLVAGESRTFAGLLWMAAQSVEAAAEKPADSNDPSAWLVDWLISASAQRLGFERSMRDAAARLGNDVGSTSTVLVLLEGGARLVAWQGLSIDDAQRLWGRIPESLSAEILRAGARLVLPEDLGRATPGDTTIFVRGVKSVAGFPIVVEGRVYGILLVGFENVVRDLSDEKTRFLQRAASVFGVALQRALLREQLDASAFVATAQGVARDRLMIGKSRALTAVYGLLEKLAPSSVPILVSGESGTGKELAAREVHRLSPRAAGPFIAVNAAALPATLVEAELFGYRRGAFTGALSDRSGLVEQAAGGTLFIDEIAEVPFPLQAKLLRVLQEKCVTRLGDNKPRAIDFRLVTASHADLQAMVRARTFREDLYYRIAGARIELPPLRERKDDILALADFFKTRYATTHQIPDKEWSAAARTALVQNGWPGNVRELQFSVERALLLADGPVIQAKDLGEIAANQEMPDIDPERSGASAAELPLSESKEDWMRGRIVDALDKNGWNKAATARTLGIGLRTLFRYIDQLGIRRADHGA